MSIVERVSSVWVTDRSSLTGVLVGRRLVEYSLFGGTCIGLLFVLMVFFCI